MALYSPDQKQLALFDLDGEPINPGPVIRKPGMKKQYVMYAIFGQLPDKICGECAILCRQQHRTSVYFKCQKYGITRGAGTDWRKKWMACGAFVSNEGETHD